MRRIAFIVLVCLVALNLSFARGDDRALNKPSEPKTPEEVVTLCFERVKSSGVGEIAKLMHPEELKKFRVMFEPVVLATLADGDDTFQLFADGENPGKVRVMNDVEFMETFMRWISLEVPAVAVAMRNSTMQAIGHVVEGDVKHVVVRAKVKMDQFEMEKMSVWSVRDFEGRPMLMMVGDMKGMAEQFKLKRRR